MISQGPLPWTVVFKKIMKIKLIFFEITFIKDKYTMHKNDLKFTYITVVK